MGRVKRKAEHHKPNITNEYEMHLVEYLVRQLFMDNYQVFGIKKYKVTISPDKTRVVLNAVIDTPFPTFMGVE